MEDSRAAGRTYHKVDDLPKRVRNKVDAMLGEKPCTYQEIQERLKEEGYEIGRNAIHRYASSMGAAQRMVREMGETTRQLVEALRDDQDMEATEVANALLLDALIRRIATAEEEFATIPLEKAMQLLVSLQNTTSFKARATGKREKIVQEVRKSMLVQLREAVQGDEALLARLTELVEQTGREVLADEG